jgi:hypothetical protein
LNTKVDELDFNQASKAYHLPDWHKLSHPQRLGVIRQIALMRGRDHHLARIVVGILKRAGARPRQYKEQAAALLAWVQDPNNVYYANEPGERLQDPLYTIKAGHGDCDDQISLLCAMFESIGLPWKLVLSGLGPQGKTRHIEGQEIEPGVRWTHIYCMVGVPPYKPTRWFFCEPTVERVPLGWDVISGDHRYLPEMTKTTGPERIELAPPYREVYGDSAGLVGGTIAGTMAQEEDEGGGPIDWTKIGQAVATGVLVSVGTSLLLNYINGTGLWENEGSVVSRWKKVVKPSQRSAFVAPSLFGNSET